MRYVLKNGSIAKFDTLRKDYEKKKGVDLSREPSFIGRPIALGGTNVTARNKQISFLEKIKIVLQNNFAKKEEELDTPEKFLLHLAASRAYIAACMYIKDQIGPNWDSKLCELIDSNLGFTDTNKLDDNDKEVCFQTANRILNYGPKALEQANLVLVKANRKPISEAEWKKFTEYSNAKASEEKIVNPYTSYPVSSITRPLCGSIFKYTGATVGFLGGDVATSSIAGMSVRYKVTAVVGGILLLGPVSPTGVALFAPVIAGKLVTTFCKISIASVLGETMSWVGQGVGLGVGLPLDLAYNLIWKTCSVIANYYSQGTQLSDLNGIRIEDGTIMLGGVPVELTAEDKLPKNVDHVVEIDTKGQVFVNGQEVDEESAKSIQIPESVLEELKKEIQAHHQDVASMTDAGATTADLAM